MKRQTKHVIFGLLFMIMAGAGAVAQAQQPCPVDCPPKPICAPVVEAPKPVEVVCAPQPVCAPVVQTQPVCAPVVQAQPVEVVCTPQPVCAPVVQCCGGEELDDLLERIEQRSDSLRKHLPDDISECLVNKCVREGPIKQQVVDYEVATDQLEDSYKDGTFSNAEVQEVLNRAAYIDGIMRSYNVGGEAASEWSLLRADLDQLASCFNATTRWCDQAQAPNTQVGAPTAAYRPDPPIK